MKGLVKKDTILLSVKILENIEISPNYQQEKKTLLHFFILKLNEVDDLKSQFNKIIIFDDPMTSNDDTMQYLIIEELTNLIKKLSNQDKIIIMTHNNHFYLNIKYKYSDYKNNMFFRFVSDGKNIKIIKLIKPEEDFKTNYEAMWQELEFLYRNASFEAMLLNPIRRIIETFTKFNSINKKMMLSHVAGAEKMFNVNSHSIDDLESDLNGRSKIDIMRIMRECFEKENALSHFRSHWTIDLDKDACS